MVTSKIFNSCYILKLTIFRSWANPGEANSLFLQSSSQ